MGGCTEGCTGEEDSAKTKSGRSLNVNPKSNQRDLFYSQPTFKTPRSSTMLFHSARSSANFQSARGSANFHSARSNANFLSPRSSTNFQSARGSVDLDSPRMSFQTPRGQADVVPQADVVDRRAPTTRTEINAALSADLAHVQSQVHSCSDDDTPKGICQIMPRVHQRGIAVDLIVLEIPTEAPIQCCSDCVVV